MSNKPEIEIPDACPPPLAWAMRYLPQYFKDPPADFHAELIGDLVRPDARLVARIAPRGHAKSTCAALAYPLWSICERRRVNIVIVTHEGDLARQFVRDIRHELEANERIHMDYGDLCRGADDDDQPSPARRTRAARGKWTEDKFITATRVAVQARSCGASFRGVRVGPHRPDLVICDDVEKDEQVASPQRRRKLEQWLRRVVMPALAPDGQLVILGSLIHYDSLLSNLRDRRRFPGWDYRVYRALEYQRDADNQWRPRPLWPARWPVERLFEERDRIGTLAFEQEYQANPIDDALRIFREEWLRPRRALDEEPPRSEVPLMTVDPAAGGESGDFFAVWVGGVEVESGVIRTRELLLERINIVDQVKRILELYRRWRPMKIGIETVAYQAALRDALADAGRRARLYPPIVDLRTRANKRVRIEGLAPLLESGSFRLPSDISDEALSQFLEFPKGRHDDAPDVCAMGVELARDLLGGAARVEGLTLPRENGRAMELPW